MSDDEKVQLLINYMGKTIGSKEDEWRARPPGYPDQVEAALIDSIFSLRAVYGRSNAKGPRAVVQRWANHVDRPLNDLRALVSDVEGLGGPDEFRRVLKHDGVAVPNAADKPTKALAVYVSAKALVDFGVITAADVRRERGRQPKALLRAVQTGRGVGPQAATYFLMLLGVPGVKADVMVKRFVDSALGVKVSDREAADLVTAAAGDLDADVIRLDHAIWDYQSSLARAGETNPK